MCAEDGRKGNKQSSDFFGQLKITKLTAADSELSRFLAQFSTKFLLLTFKT